MAKATHVLFFVGEQWLIGTSCRKVVPTEFEEITPVEALQRYGPEHVFEASDKSGSYLGDKSTLTDRWFYIDLPNSSTFAYFLMQKQNSITPVYSGALN